MRTLGRLMACGIAVGVLIAAAVQGAVYYVAGEDPAAADTNPGTEERPWKTINRLVPTVRPGDTVYVKKGVYREEVMLRRDGWTWEGVKYPPMAVGTSYAEMISIVSLPRGAAEIRGSDVVTGWTPYTNQIWMRDWPVNSQQVFCDGMSLQQIGGTNAVCEYWNGRVGEGLQDMRRGSFTYDSSAKKLYLWLADGSDPNTHLIEVSVRCFLMSVNADYVRVSGFVMQHATPSRKVNWAAVHLNGRHNILEHCDILWSDFGGLGVGGENNTVIGCRMNHHGNNGLGAGGWGHRFINCETSFNNYRHWSTGWHAGGVKIIPFAHDILMSGHLAVSNEGDGIWFDAGNFNVTVQNSISRHNKGNGIHYEISERGTFRNNVLYENGGRGIYLSTASDCYVLHNLLYRNGMSGVASIAGPNRKYPPFGTEKEFVYWGRNNVVWGNIFVDNCHPARCPKDPDGRDQPWDTRAELILPHDDPANYGNLSDYNLFWRSADRVLPFWKGWHVVEYPNLEAWREGTGNDRHSVIARPVFVNEAAYDFRPAKDSPAVGLVKPEVGAVYDGRGALRYPWEARPEEVRFTAGPWEPER